MNSNQRQFSYRKNTSLENLFPEMEQLLGDTENKQLEAFTDPQLPIFFILGCARSGTTLLYQYLAQSGLFNYPTNLVSRFYYAPYIGARIQQLLVDFDSNGEIFNASNQYTFKSELGKTFGPTQPHEFWYFWDRFFKFGELQQLSQDCINSLDWLTFRRELRAFESVYNKPLLMKAMKLNWHLTLLKKHIPNIHFVFIKREVLYNAQSLLLARDIFFGDRQKWYSFKPANYDDLKRLSPEQQVVEQVKATNNAIEAQLHNLDEEDYTVINYSAFCESPSEKIKPIYAKIPQHLRQEDSVGNASFDSGNTQKVDDPTFQKLKSFI